MNRQELIAKLKVLQGDDDAEKAHVVADDLLLEYLADEEIASEYKKIEKWYS